MSNLACADRKMADAIVRAVYRLDPGLILLAPSASQLAYAGLDKGLPVVEEIFADRAYLDDGQLVPRARADAMIHGAEASLAHVSAMLDEQALISVTGKRLPCTIGSICVHGDGPDAVRTARFLREELLHRGYRLAPLELL